MKIHSALLKNSLNKNTIIFLFILFTSKCLIAADVLFRIGDESSIIDQYVNNPNGYPICKAGVDFRSMDDNSVANRQLFTSNRAIIELGFYNYMLNAPVRYCNSVVGKIRAYEDAGWDVFGMILYNETWLDKGPGGPYTEDARIIPEDTLITIRNAIRDANPPLKCKDDVKLILILGGQLESNILFSQLPTSLKTYLLKFDGLGRECHINDNVSRPEVLKDMAAISKWTKDNSKICLNFMGGTATTYENLNIAQKTYNNLWNEMTKVGIDKKSDHIIYFRQGGRPGKHAPEIEGTLCNQIKWLINTVKVAPILYQKINFNAIATKQFGAADFNAGATSSSELTITYTSSNTNVATIVNGNIHVVGVGTSLITASQEGDTTYKAAANMLQTLTVNKQSQTITFNAIPIKLINDADFDAGATSNSGLTISYRSSKESVATIVNDKIHIVGAGTAIITASQAGNNNYNAATEVSNTIKVLATNTGTRTLSPKIVNTIETFEISPNPALEYVNINLGSKTSVVITIYNAIGLKVYTIHNVKNKICIPTNKIGDVGLYFIEVNGKTKKLIISK